ncbi:MAG: hydantoinase B/oxoprolinase family protein, partial [Thermomicrobiales bacterium]|nr:hydantoinase B/oxoprolinase family protein [Thermomicrobiales bacterium]
MFVRNDLLRAALTENLGDQLAFSEIAFEWPRDPFGPVAEVKEAAGTEEQLIAALAGQEIIVTEMAALTRHVIKNAPDLRLIVVCRGGPVNVNLEAATEQGIPVCYSPARNAAATAEYTIGLLLSTMRHISEGHRDLLSGTWRGDLYAYDVAGIEIEGKTAGLIGFGAVGSRVAKVLRAFGAEVLVADPYVAAEVVEEAGATLLPMDEVLARAEILSLHARLTPETHHLIDADAIAALPDGDHRFADALDDGTPVVVTVRVRGDRLAVDFTGTGAAHPGNLNAPRAVAVAAVLYVLRCLVGAPIPLNAGVLAGVTLVIPPGSLLAPPPGRAVCGGNVETSQRVVDVLLGALGLAAASQGTMNNLTLGRAAGPGRAALAYYETIGGGAGAT